MMDLYKISLQDNRRSSLKLLRENERAYALLTNKESSYAKQIKALGDLHKQVYEIYKNAPSKIED
jgi:hypothetical protein